MKYLLIRNAGKIEFDALHLMGASSKRGNKEKIGMFGTGNKYALALLLRQKYPFKIFSGLTEIRIDTERITFRDKTFDVIVVNNQKTSLTTEMGMEWKLWYAIREIYCNALDEGAARIQLTDTISPVDGETHFYIEIKDELLEIINDFDRYFSERRHVLEEGPVGQILSKALKPYKFTKLFQDVNDPKMNDILRQPYEANIYRKGIRVIDSSQFKTVYDYNFHEIQINESRQVVYQWEIPEKIWNMVFHSSNVDVINNVFAHCSDQSFMEADIASFLTSLPGKYGETFKAFVQERKFAPYEFAGKVDNDELVGCILIPNRLMEHLQALGLITEENIASPFKKKVGDIFFTKRETLTPLENATLKKAMDFFGEVKYPITFPVEVVSFNGGKVLGKAHNGTIYLSDTALAQGTQETVETIIEEQIHLISSAGDETRHFQNAIINEFVKYMKTQNSIAL